MRRFAVLIAVVASCAAGCGGDDEPEEGGTAGNALSAKTQTVRHDALPFTFALPGDFARAPRREGFIVVYGLDPLNVVDVRRAADHELPPDRIEATYRDTLGKLGYATDDVTRETIGGLTTVRFTIDATSAGQQTRSDLHFFALGGQTWELECQSTEMLRKRIDDACAKALASVRRTGT